MKQKNSPRQEKRPCREVEINGLKVRLKFAEADDHEVTRNVRDILLGVQELYRAA